LVIGHTDSAWPERFPTAYVPFVPVAYNCVKVIVVRDGSAVLFSEFGRQRVATGGVGARREHLVVASRKGT
jgi:hypothetical protein